MFPLKIAVNGVVDVATGVGQIYNRLANVTTNSTTATVGSAAAGPAYNVNDPNRDVEFVTNRNRNPSEFSLLRN